MKRTTLKVWVWLLAAAMGTAVQAAPESAEQLEERIAIGFVEAVASGNAQTVAAYMAEHFLSPSGEVRSAEEWSRMAEQLAGRHPGLEVAGVEIAMPHRVSIEARDPDGRALTMGFEFQAAPPHRVIGLDIRPGGRRPDAPDLPALKLAAGADPDAIRGALETWFAQLDGFSGAALVAVDGRPLFETAAGLASRSWNVPNRTSTRFDLGSINKTFTQVALAQLLHQGRLTLDDTVADRLPDYPNREAAERITVRQLVEHSSGLGDIFTDQFARLSPALFRQPEDFFQLLADRPLRFEPGSRSEYSNAGYMVLGAIIAAVSGQPYDQYVTEKVFGPAGMKSALFHSKDEPAPDIAVGYTHMGPDGKLRNNNYLLPIRGNSAGSAYASVTDLLHFDNALREHRLLPPAWSRWVLGGPEPTAESEADTDAERLQVGIGIAGGAPGVSSVMESDGRLTIIVLSNQDEPGAERIGRQLRQALQGVVRG